VRQGDDPRSARAWPWPSRVQTGSRLVPAMALLLLIWRRTRRSAWSGQGEASPHVSGISQRQFLNAARADGLPPLKIGSSRVSTAPKHMGCPGGGLPRSVTQSLAGPVAGPGVAALWGAFSGQRRGAARVAVYNGGEPAGGCSSTFTQAVVPPRPSAGDAERATRFSLHGQFCVKRATQARRKVSQRSGGLTWVEGPWRPAVPFSDALYTCLVHVARQNKRKEGRKGVFFFRC